MTIRDVAADFGFIEATRQTPAISTTSVVGGAGTYLGCNSYDATRGAGAYLTELTQNDTLLTVGGTTYFFEDGVPGGIRICVDWVTQPIGSGTLRTQLLTSPLSSLASPTVMIDFGALPIATFFAGYRQIAHLPRSNQWQRYIGLQVITSAPLTAGAFVAWLALDLDSELLGYAEGFSIK